MLQNWGARRSWTRLQTVAHRLPSIQDMICGGWGNTPWVRKISLARDIKTIRLVFGGHFQPIALSGPHFLSAEGEIFRDRHGCRFQHYMYIEDQKRNKEQTGKSGDRKFRTSPVKFSLGNPALSAYTKTQ